MGLCAVIIVVIIILPSFINRCAIIGEIYRNMYVFSHLPYTIHHLLSALLLGFIGRAEGGGAGAVPPGGDRAR